MIFTIHILLNIKGLFNFVSIFLFYHIKHFLSILLLRKFGPDNRKRAQKDGLLNKVSGLKKHGKNRIF